MAMAGLPIPLDYLLVLQGFTADAIDIPITINESCAGLGEALVKPHG